MRTTSVLVAALVCGAWTTAAGAGDGADLVEGLHSSASMPSISGHFTLQTLDGREVTDTSYRGKWLLVYFGYTSCPDVCPTTLLRIGQALQLMGPRADKVQPLFITLDPARDTQPRLTKYMAAFDPRLVGLRGDSEQVRMAARQFHVYYRLRNLGDGEYTVDHSSFLYIVGPDGHFAKLLADSVPAEDLAEELRKLAR
jgi:protein SCO1/2